MNTLHLLAQFITNSELNIPQGGLTNSRVRTSLSIIFGIAGSLSVLVIVVAGLRYVAAAGDPKGAAKAKNAVIFAVVGLMVSAIALVS